MQSAVVVIFLRVKNVFKYKIRTQFYSLFRCRRSYISRSARANEGSVLKACIVIDSWARLTQALSWGNLVKFWWPVLENHRIARIFCYITFRSSFRWKRHSWDTIFTRIEVMDNDRNWLRFQPDDFNEQGIHRFVKQWDNCLCIIGDYIWNKLTHFIHWLLFRFHLINNNILIHKCK